MSDLRKENGKVVLCCGRGRCPELQIKNNKVFITDDHGNTIEIEKDQASLIPEAINALDSEEANRALLRK